MSNNMIRLNRYYTIFTFYICNRSATPANTHLADLSLVLKLKVQIYVGPEIMTMDYLSIYFSIQTPLSCFVNRTLIQISCLLFVLGDSLDVHDWHGWIQIFEG